MAARLSTAHTVIKRSRMLNPLLPPDYGWPARVPPEALEEMVRKQSRAALVAYEHAIVPVGVVRDIVLEQSRAAMALAWELFSDWRTTTTTKGQ